MKKTILLTFLLFSGVCLGIRAQETQVLELITKNKLNQTNRTAEIQVKVLNGSPDFSYVLYKNFIKNNIFSKQLSYKENKFTFIDVPEGTYMLVITDVNNNQGAQTVSISFKDKN